MTSWNTGANSFSSFRFFVTQFVILMLAFAGCAYAQSGHALESAQAAKVRVFNNSILQLHGQMQENASGAAWIRGQAATVIAERAAALTTLMQQEPRAALSFAFSPELLADLAGKFPQSASQLESHATVIGELQHWIEDGADLKTSRSYFLLKAGGRTLNLHFAGQEPGNLKSGEALQVTGVVVGSSMAVETSKIVPSIAATASTSAPTFAGSLAAINFVPEQRGPMFVLLICVAALTMLRRWASNRSFREQIRRYAVCAVAVAILVFNPSISSAQTSTCSTTGVQNTAVLLVNFSDIPTTVDSATANIDFFDASTGRSLNGFWQEASYGQTSAAGSVFGPFTVGASTSYTCSTVFSQLTNDVLAAAIAGGVNLHNYTRIFVVLPGLSCSWSGLTVIGSAGAGCSTWSTSAGTLTASLSYIVDSFITTTYYPWTNARDGAVALLAHEGGHQLGLAHSGTITDSPTAVLEPPDTLGQISDRGDEFTVMGANNLGLYQAQQKAEILGWITSTTNYQTVTTSGSYTIQPIETKPPALQALKIQRGSSNPGYYLWVEYKQPIGQYDSTLANAPLSNQPYTGAMVTYEDPIYETGGQIPGHTYLLDFNLSDTYWTAPDLNPGQTWTDLYTNVSFSTLSATSSGLTVSVNYGATPCTSATPGVTVLPLNPSIYPGQSASYSVSVTNNDSSGCSSSTISLGSSEPSGWSTSLSSSSVTLSPGQTASVTLGKGAPSGTPAGTYAVNLNVSTSASTGSATANATVMTPPSLAVSISVSGSSFTRPGTVPITASVTNGGTPVSGASVSFTVTAPNGGTSTQTATTGTNGTSTWNYKLNAKSLAGTYSVSAQAALSSGSKKAASTQSASSNTASFSVQ
jgi:M6 family metalloprotease-like protein